MHRSLVTADWLIENLDDPDVIVLDASPTSNIANIEIKHPDVQIVGARHFNLKDHFSDKDSDLPNMMPSADAFTKASKTIGINANSKIVIYDNLGVYSSPRAWWMLKVMGHETVAVLDGGLEAWIASGGETEIRSNRTYPQGDFVACLDVTAIKNSTQLLQNLTSKDFAVVDARSEGRFKAEIPEPRATSRSGCIPGSHNLPYQDLFQDGKFLPKQALKARFNQMNLGEGPLVFSCGSGLTACIVLLGATLVLDNELAIYDGSWSEWGDVDRAFPIAKIAG